MLCCACLKEYKCERVNRNVNDGKTEREKMNRENNNTEKAVDYTQRDINRRRKDIQR